MLAQATGRAVVLASEQLAAPARDPAVQGTRNRTASVSIADAEEDAKASRKAADASQAKRAERLNDDRFVSGFGSNGGEEFLSYLLMSEALLRGPSGCLSPPASMGTRSTGVTGIQGPTR